MSDFDKISDNFELFPEDIDKEDDCQVEQESPLVLYYKAANSHFNVFTSFYTIKDLLRITDF